MTEERDQQKESTISLKEFLESIPPGKEAGISDALISFQSSGFHPESPRQYLSVPRLHIYCAMDLCKGMRFFEPETSQLWLDTPLQFLNFTCKNCGKRKKVYAVHVFAAVGCRLFKLGELPPFGAPTPARLASLIGPDLENFLKGRRSENEGLGIGAFAYYRRIVEDQKDRIFDELIRACKKVNAPADIIQDLERAKGEVQFTKAVESMKHGLPKSLLIDEQHNPLALLHSALSEAIHEHIDEECLKFAKDIRVVLADMVERVAEVMKDSAELDGAVTRLMKAASAKKLPAQR